MKPILFNTEMVRAILDGRKTVTRRVIKYSCSSNPQSTLDDFIGNSDQQLLIDCSPYRVGDVLYVRETWAKNAYGGFFYKADGKCEVFSWHPSIHMPKEAARLFLRVTDVRLERLQEATLYGFLDEGVSLRPEAFNDPDNAYLQARHQFSDIWDRTIKKTNLPLYGWNANPWVWVIKFEMCETPCAKNTM